MKSYDIFVDRRLIQGDLTVVGLTLRKDVAAYDYIEIDSSVKKLLGEKAVLFTGNTDDIVLNHYLAPGYKSVGAQKFESAKSTLQFDAIADFSNMSVLRVDGNEIEFDSQAKEISQKIERALSDIAIGVDGGDAFESAKSVGDIENVVLVGVNLNEFKQAFPKLADDKNIAIIDAVATPLVTYYDGMENEFSIDASVKSLSYLIYSRLIRSEVNIGVEPIDAMLLFSLGKGSMRISIGANAAMAVRFLEKAENEITVTASALPVLYMIYNPTPSGVVLSNAGAAILRKFRKLTEVDKFGTLANLDEMSLDDIDYITIEE